MPLHTPGLVLCPTELVKCRLQAARQMGVTGAGVIRTVRCKYFYCIVLCYNNFPVCRNILVTDGVSGLFRGLIPTWCREIPGYFCFFLGYETSRSLGSYPIASQFLHRYYTYNRDTE